MNKLFFVAIPFLILACSQKHKSETVASGNEIISDREFTMEIVDTVLVDPGEEIIYTQYGLYRADWSSDLSKLYNYNGHDNSIEVIDLDDLSLQEKFQLEKEGPNGTEDHIQSFDFFRGKFLLSTFNKINAFGSTSQRIFQINIDELEFSGDSLEQDIYPKTRGMMDPSGQYFLVLYEAAFGDPRGLASSMSRINPLIGFPFRDWMK
ncbi:DUF4221 domain-containing protein [Echinicola soli]|uniref:DUF4221 domain-containing protein n=1 Tax=Echinicola soli TaxID=2591634 RepID=A0A514CFF8_9BACT|nr:DUF4221 family protein [Echinicola soli]QDH78394.1 DUF4221 domain-containing protein [Echinicola soli]